MTQMRPAGPPPVPAASPPRIPVARSLILWDADNCRPPKAVPPPALVHALVSAVEASARSDLGLNLGAAPPPVALFANAATLGGCDVTAAWTDAGVTAVHSVPCRPGAADQALTTAAVEFVRGVAGEHNSPPSLLVLASADADFAQLVRWAGAQPGVATLVIGGFRGPRTGGRDGWRARAELARAAQTALHWREVLEAAARR
jgi:hypothetical protein